MKAIHSIALMAAAFALLVLVDQPARVRVQHG